MDKKEFVTSVAKSFCVALCSCIAAKVAVKAVEFCGEKVTTAISKYKEFNKQSIEDMFAED